MMREYDVTTYGERMAEVYDQWPGVPQNTEAMVAGLRAKPGGEHIPVTIGNFADMAVEGRFTLIFVVFNTFFGLLSQDDQVRCFQGVSRHLTDEGVFVLEAFVPDLARYDRGQRVEARQVETDHVHLATSV